MEDDKMGELEKKYSVSLTFDELTALDGRCSDEIQGIVDEAKAVRAIGLDDFSNEVIAQAVMDGHLQWYSVNISRCKYCGERPCGFYPYKSSGRNHRKGEPNTRNPIRYSGVQTGDGILFSGLAGMCAECWDKKYLPKIVRYILDNDLPVEIQRNDIAPTRYKRDLERQCFECGKTMCESEMGERYSPMSGGYSKSKCPHCGAESTIYNPHKLTGKFRMIPAEAAGEAERKRREADNPF